MATSLQGFMQPQQQDPLAALLAGYGSSNMPGQQMLGLDDPTANFGSASLAQAFPTLGGGAEGGGLFGGMLGTTDKNGIMTQGWGGMALGAAQALGNAYMGMKQYGLAKDTLNQNKKEFALNYDAQQSTVNAQLRDRQNARVASNPGAYQSVSAYMDQNGIKPRG